MTASFLQFVLEHESDNLGQLALQANRFPHIDMPQALQQIKGKQIAKEKIPSWYANENIVYPLHISLEQSSSEATAKFKSTIFSGQMLVDLTGGMGVDISFLSSNFEKAIYVESQPYLEEIAKQNFRTLELNNIETHCMDAIDFLYKADESIDTIYIDPARRNDSGKKTVLIEDCVPNIIDIQEQLNKKAKRVIIKLSPMLDISLALQKLDNVTDVYIISHKNECKELLFIKQKEDKEQETQLHCINILNNETTEYFSFTKSEESNSECIYNTSQVEQFLYEPNASILKSGAYKTITHRYKIKKLHPNSNLYTSATPVLNFPGRIFEVKSVFSLNKKDLKANLNEIESANITVRNFPLSPEQLRSRLRIKDGGDTYIFATTLFDEEKVLISGQKVQKQNC